MSKRLQEPRCSNGILLRRLPHPGRTLQALPGQPGAAAVLRMRGAARLLPAEGWCDREGGSPRARGDQRSALE